MTDRPTVAAGPALLDYRADQPMARRVDVRKHVLPAPMRVINVIVGSLSAVAHGALGMLVVLVALPRGGVGADARILKLFALLALLAATSAVVLVVASFARRQRWLVAWAGFEALVTLGSWALVGGGKHDIAVFTLMRVFAVLGYMFVVLWMSCPPERR